VFDLGKIVNNPAVLLHASGGTLEEPVKRVVMRDVRFHWLQGEKGSIRNRGCLLELRGRQLCGTVSSKRADRRRKAQTGGVCETLASFPSVSWEGGGGGDSIRGKKERNLSDQLRQEDNHFTRDRQRLPGKENPLREKRVCEMGRAPTSLNAEPPSRKRTNGGKLRFFLRSLSQQKTSS